MTKACVVIPFKDRHDQLRQCLDSLEPQLTSSVDVLVIDDGSRDSVEDHADWADRLSSGRLHLVRQDRNHGVSAARNTGIKWCLDRDYDLVLMIDSDCIAPTDWVGTHLALHARYPDIPVIGGSIRGEGAFLWARLDRMMTWFHVIPGSPARELPAPYTLPTANISIKIRALPFGDTFFDARLRTGEDSAFSNRVRNAGYRIMFSPVPEIAHKDRETFSAVLKHQYEFGRHHFYTSHMSRDLTHLCFNPLYRMVFGLGFVIGLPVYAAWGCFLNMRPWLKHDRRNLLYWPLLQVFWLVKGIAVLEAIFLQKSAFRLEQTPAGTNR